MLYDNLINLKQRMERLLRPAKLDVDPNAANSSQVYRHWLKTFQRFILAVEATRNVEDPATDKYGLLVNFLSPEVYAYVEETTNYDSSALGLLERAYIKPKNIVMARHLLSIRNQLPGESISEFLVNLRHMAKDCNFKAVDAQTYQEHMIRDAFTKGLESSTIRQRILENENIT